jgi:outer membrane protein OmpA-like peptidoglycan-associated protein
MRSSMHTLFAASLATSLAACVAAVPKELADARAAYERASHGRAAELAPTELHIAKAALDEAEQAFGENPNEPATYDLAHVARRRSLFAELTASRLVETELEAQGLQKAQANALTQARADHASSERDASEANQRVQVMKERLANVASVEQDQRGTIVTLAASRLFSSNESTLLRTAERLLNEVSRALPSSGESRIRVESYTDSWGSEDANLIFSQERAEAVRSYLVSRGYEPARIQAWGMGESQPLASNDDAEGRARNRRVELVLKP